MITAFSVRGMAQVPPPLQYAPSPGRLHGVQFDADENSVPGASVYEHAVTTLIDFEAVPLLSRPPFDTVRFTAYVPAVPQAGEDDGVPVALLNVPGVPLENVQVHCVIGYAYVPALELVPLMVSGWATTTESAPEIAAFSVRFVVHVAPLAMYPPSPLRGQGTQAAAVLNVPAGDSVSAHAATTFRFFATVPGLSNPPFETVRLTEYVPAALHVGGEGTVPSARVSDAGEPDGNVHAH